MKSRPGSQNLYNKAMDSSGALEEANAQKAESIQGRMNTFKDTLNQMWSNLIDSDSIKNVISASTLLISGIDKINSKFGLLPVTMTLVSGAFVMFNKRARETMTTLGNCIPIISSLNGKLKAYSDTLKEKIVNQQKDIEKTKEGLLVANQSSSSIKNQNQQLVKQQTNLTTLRTRVALATLAQTALNTAMRKKTASPKIMPKTWKWQ